jgi:hypothetical protein
MPGYLTTGQTTTSPGRRAPAPVRSAVTANDQAQMTLSLLSPRQPSRRSQAPPEATATACEDQNEAAGRWPASAVGTSSCLAPAGGLAAGRRPGHGPAARATPPGPLSKDARCLKGLSRWVRAGSSCSSTRVTPPSPAACSSSGTAHRGWSVMAVSSRSRMAGSRRLRARSGWTRAGRPSIRGAGLLGRPDRMARLRPDIERSLMHEGLLLTPDT